LRFSGALGNGEANGLFHSYWHLFLVIHAKSDFISSVNIFLLQAFLDVIISGIAGCFAGQGFDSGLWRGGDQPYLYML
jgi:hypothetical protein